MAASVDAVDIVAPPRPRLRSLGLRRIATRVDRAAESARQLIERAGGRRGRRRYRLLVAGLQNLDDVYALRGWPRLVGLADVSACVIDELYARQIPEHHGAIRLLRQFDLLFVGCAGTVDALARATGRPCAYLAPSVDALVACPYPRPPQRAIDVYALGRRTPGMHSALLAYAARHHAFYLYDTFGDATITGHREHRSRLVGLLQRTRYLPVNVARCNDPAQRGGQQELGFRYFEGAAAGAVMVGRFPDHRVAHALFDWPDAVIPVELDSDALGAALEALDAAPERCERIRRANVAGALRRHDHGERWAEILRAAGLAPTAALEARRRARITLAEALESPPGRIASLEGALA